MTQKRRPPLRREIRMLAIDLALSSKSDNRIWRSYERAKQDLYFACDDPEELERALQVYLDAAGI